MTSPKKNGPIVQITLRIPQSLLDPIDKLAAARRRSRNSEILSCIEFATAEDPSAL